MFYRNVAENYGTIKKIDDVITRKQLNVEEVAVHEKMFS